MSPWSEALTATKSQALTCSGDWKRTSRKSVAKVSLPNFFGPTPKAFHQNKRYIDVDLNRCFLLADLNNEKIESYEGNRAKVINTVLGPKGNPGFDFTFDVHTTTSNMGVTLILVGMDRYQLRLASFIKRNLVNVNVLCFDSQGKDSPNLCSITPRMLGLEIGPIPQGVLRHDIFAVAYDALKLGLDYIDRVNKGDEPEVDSRLDVFVHRGEVGYPLDADGNICAMVHRNLQDKDFSELRKGEPAFVKLNGETIDYEGDETVYPVFINEAAYYDKKTAFWLTDKRSIDISQS